MTATALTQAPQSVFSTDDLARRNSMQSNVVEPESPAPRLVYDLLLRRVREAPNAPFFGYPASIKGKADYIFHTAKDIHQCSQAAARQYLQDGVVPKHPSPRKAEVIAMLATSNDDYVISMFALSRMGFAILFLSNRLAPDAVINLMQKTDCTKLIVSPQYAAVAASLRDEHKYPVSVYEIIRKDQYLSPKSDSYSPGSLSSMAPPEADPSTLISFIIHSSGSTGLPKPIFQTHASCLANYSTGIPYRAFITLPLFHNHGISTLFRALCAGKQASLYNASLPLSGTNLVESIRAVQPESLHCVPYALKLMAEDPRGIDTLRHLKLVLFGGSSCPLDLGDRLIAAGVYLVGHYGATEMGQLMTSFRDPETDKDWAYMRPMALAKPFLRMVPRGSNTFECMVLDGLPSKVMANSDDPPNSYYTRDLFEPHPTRPDAWRYVSRIDDRITLINGEKVLPIPFEHRIRQSDLVKECIVFGVDRAIPGLAVIPSEKAITQGLADKRVFLDALMPTVETANAQSESFGHISQEMVEVMDPDTSYPATDKGTVIRAEFYKTFADMIDGVYARFERPASGNGILLVLDQTGLEAYLLALFTGKIGVRGLTETTDVFEAGMDSLQAIAARANLLREIDLGGQVLAQNVVFEYPTIRLLAQHLLALRTGSGPGDKFVDEIQEMRDLIAKYSDFSAFSNRKTNCSSRAEHEGVMLTGATGSLGAHILHQLVSLPNIKYIYCLVRAPSQEAAQDRVQHALASRGLAHLAAEEIQNKVFCLPADLSLPTLGLADDILQQLRSHLTTVIHAAWAVNFNLGVRSFESHHIRGTYNLLNVCLSTETSAPARLFFCSSVSAGAATPIPGTVHETYITNLAHAQPMGYARSKVVAEHIIQTAGEQTGMTAHVLRLGQIVGDAEHGIWNTTEAVPLILRSALTTGVLPALNETPSWLPVDKMASSVVELSGLSDPERVRSYEGSVVYQVQNRRLFNWTKDLLPALKAAGLGFTVVSQREWVTRLRESDPDPARNPTIKLLDFFTEKYDNDRPGRAGLVFETRRTEEASQTMADGFDIIGRGLVGKMVAWWQTQWQETGSAKK